MQPAAAATHCETFDVVVVGGSFAGLSFASVAAARGLRVLVLERDATIGAVVRTTGVLFSDVLDVTDVPAQYLMNSVRRLRIRAADQEPVEIGASAFRFYMADVPGMLTWMAQEAQQRGAMVRCDAPMVDASRAADGWMSVTYRAPTLATESQSAAPTLTSVRARMVIGADGARSLVAQRMGLDRNEHLLAGAEWLVDNVALDGETFYLVMDHALAPGYCVWLAPHGNVAALGVAGHLRAFKPAETLSVAPQVFSDVADFSRMRVRERKAGVIPVGGRLRHVYRDDARGRALLLGDAAGLCGAATGGGIYPALICGRLASQAVANELLNGVSGAVKAYLRDLSQAGRLGHYLQIEDWMRWALDRMGSNADWGAFMSLFRSEDGRRVLQRALLEQPIISMDSGFFALLRGVLTKHPRVYGAAFRAAWQRVTARA